MSVQLNPYLSFRDNAREALTFYHSVFGGELTMNTFADLGMSAEPGEEDRIMHGNLQGDNGVVIMASDTPHGREYEPGTAFAVSLSGDDDARLRGYWDQLTDGGTATVPLERAPWGDSFGMCLDRFGIQWMVNIAGASSA